MNSMSLCNVLIVFIDYNSNYQSKNLQLLIVSNYVLYYKVVVSLLYLLVLNLKGESPAKRGAKRKPTELVTYIAPFLVLPVLHLCSNLARRDGGSIRRGLLEQAAVTSGRMEADEQSVVT